MAVTTADDRSGDQSSADEYDPHDLPSPVTDKEFDSDPDPRSPLRLNPPVGVRHPDQEQGQHRRLQRLPRRTRLHRIEEKPKPPPYGHKGHTPTDPMNDPFRPRLVYSLWWKSSISVNSD